VDKDNGHSRRFPLRFAVDSMRVSADRERRSMAAGEPQMPGERTARLTRRPMIL
jgi:hypothetical protein